MKQPNMFFAISKLHDLRPRRGEFWEAFDYLAITSLKRTVDIAIEISKAYLDTFKPYKAEYARRRDMAQPFLGLGNIFQGLFNLLATFVILASSTLLTLPAMFVPLNRFFNYREGGWIPAVFELPFALVSNVALAAVRVLENMALILQGLIQIATTPLSWLIKIPLRNLITYAVGSPKIEENPSMRRQVNKLRSNERCSTSTYNEVHRKFSKQVQRGQATDILNEATCYNELVRASDGLRDLELHEYDEWPVAYLRADLQRNPAYQAFDNAVVAYHRLFSPANMPHQEPPAYLDPAVPAVNNGI